MNIGEDIKGPEASERQILDQLIQTGFQFGTNNVLKEEKYDHTVYYLPCYVRFKVKEITELDIQGLQGTLFGTILFTFYYGSLDKEILNQFVGEGKQSILLHLGRQESIELKQEVKGVTFKHQHNRRMIDYVVRSSFTCRLEGDVFYTPFELINLYLSIKIQSLQLNPKDNNNKRIEIKFNCMHNDQVIMLQHSRNKTFGNYNIANHFFDCQFKDKQKPMFKPLSMLSNQRQQQQKDNEEHCDSDDDDEDDDDDDDDDNEYEYESNQKTQLKGQYGKQYNILRVRPPVKDIKREDSLESKRIRKMKEEEDSPRSKRIGKTKGGVESPRSKKIRKKKEGNADPPIKNFQYAHFRITMYKYPGVNLISTFVPLWILGLINLFIFFQDHTLANRIAGIATLTLAFIAFIPTINATIPQTPNIKLVEILVYMKAAASVLCLIQSYQGRNIIEHYDWTTDGYFISALILNLLTFFIMLILFIIHKCFWQKGYIRKINENKKLKDWKRGHWRNPKCDSKFLPLINRKKITVL